jgi:hypothetical protein
MTGAGVYGMERLRFRVEERMQVRAIAVAGLLAFGLIACEPKERAASSTPPTAEGEACPFKIATALCKSEKLSGLYGKIKADFGQASAAVSAEGKKIMADNQRAWFEAQRLSCGADPNATTLTPDQETCMESALSDRIKNAASAVEKVGPFLFQRVEVSDASKVDQSALGIAGGLDDAPSTVTTDIEYPRIDANSPAAQKFNSLVAQRPRFKSGDNTEEAVKYKIAYASPDLISVRFDMYDNTIGAAHPNTGAKALNFNMKTQAPLKAADVFKPGSGWETFLATRASAAITKELKQQDETNPGVSAADLRPYVADPANWAISDQGLVLIFSEDAMGSHAAGRHETMLPWIELKRFIAPGAPAPMNKS